MRCQNLLCVIVVVGLFACTSNPHRTDVLVQPSAPKSAASPPPPVATPAAPETSIAKGAVPTPITSSPKPANADAASRRAQTPSGLNSALRSLVGRSKSVNLPEKSSATPALDAKSERMPSGTGPAAYYIPHDMTVGEHYSVYLRIGLESGLNELTEHLRTDVAKSLKLSPNQIVIELNREAPSESVTAGKVEGISSVATGQIMKANLTASKHDFEITNVMPEEGGPIEADSDGIFSWQWSVTPIRSSDKELTLMLTASIVSERGIPHSAAGKKSIDIHVMVKAQPAPVIPPKSWLEQSTEFINGLLKSALDNLKTLIATALAGFAVLRFEKLGGIALAGLKKIKNRFS